LHNTEKKKIILFCSCFAVLNYWVLSINKKNITQNKYSWKRKGKHLSKHQWWVICYFGNGSISLC